MAPITIKPTRSDKIFQIVNTIFLSLLLLIVAYPLYFVVIACFSNPDAVARGEVILFFKDFNIEGIKFVLRDVDVLNGYRNTIVYTILGTCLNLIMTLTAGYALSVPFVGRRPIMLMMTFTMYFGGGMIPTYFLIRDLGMLNTMWVMIVPGAISVYNTMVARTFMSTNIGDSLYEAAEMDGCSRIRFFVSIVLPLSGVLIAILTLFYGVGHWNSYFNAILYISDRGKYPLQLVLREILVLNQVAASDLASMDPDMIGYMQRIADTMKYALIIITSIPVLILYPFLQKYFVKGVMVGSMKG